LQQLEKRAGSKYFVLLSSAPPDIALFSLLKAVNKQRTDTVHRRSKKAGYEMRKNYINNNDR